MSNTLKSTLQIVIVVILLAGVGYLGFKLIGFNNSPAKSTDQPTTSNSDQSIGGSTLNEKTSPSLEAEQCNTDDDCTIISDKYREKGDIKQVIQCLNKAYLSTCETCQTSESLVAETKKEANCNCVENLCNFHLLAK